MTAGQQGRPPGTARRVLMVLYFFPPVGGVAMSRSVRNVAYLPRYGWQPTVLTVRNAGYELRDEDALRLVPADARVIRTSSIEAGHFRSVASRLASRGERQRSDGGSVSRDAASEARTDSGSVRSWLGRLLRGAFFPDEVAGWIPFALVAALRADRREPFDVVFSSSGPATSHVVAGLLKRLRGTAWVAEFRDPWHGSVLDSRIPWFQARLRRKVERWIARSADRIVCVTPTLVRIYRERYPDASVVLITNGYDRSESTAGRPGVPPGRPTNAEEPERARSTRRLVYAGSLNRPSELESFLAGFQVLAADRPDLAARLSVVFYGSVSPGCRAVAHRFLRDPMVAAAVSFAGFVSRREALAAVADADAALVLLGAGRGMDLNVGGKLYDYLGLGRQILAIVPPGDARAVLAGLDWGIVADPEPRSVATALARLVDLPVPDRFPDPDGRYDREILAGELAAVLDGALAAPRARTAHT